MISPLLKISLLLLAGQHALGQQTQERTAFNSADGAVSGGSGGSGGTGGSGSSSKGSGKGSKKAGKGGGKGGGKGDRTIQDVILPEDIFTRTVFVDFEGLDTDPNDFSLVGPSALEMEFLNTYNALSTEFCDIDGVEILAALIQADDSGEYIIQRGGNKYSLEFQVMASCDSCDDSTTTLFDHSLDTSATNFFGRKMLWSISATGDTSGSSTSKSSSKSSKKGSKKSSKRAGPTNGSGSRICTSSNPLFRAPTEEEFLEGYSSALRINSGDDSSSGRRLGCDFLTGGKIAVDQVIRAYEMSDEACADVVEEFEIPVTVAIFGDYEAVTDGENEELEQAFVQNYNALQAYRCDSPSFRTLQSAEIKMVSPDGDNTFTYIFDVKGTCRGTGCSDESRIFSDVSARLRRLQDTISTDECSCPISAEEQGPPMSEEMKILFDETIGELRACGAVENVLGVGSVGEMSVDFTSAPSATPSSVPSGAPSTSAQPSMSAAPTGTAPTISSSPSAQPSLTPSISLAPSKSAQPSNAPSISNAPSKSSPPSLVPSEAAVPSISTQPSIDPTALASASPSLAPSVSAKPSNVPSRSSSPSTAPSQGPSTDPSIAPSQIPSNLPSKAPSNVPTLSQVPSKLPSFVPSNGPTRTAEPSTSEPPSLVPTESQVPSAVPSIAPSGNPSLVPSKSGNPSLTPSKSPSTSAAPSKSAVPSDPVGASDGGTVNAGAVEEEDDDDDEADDDADDDGWDDDEWDDDDVDDDDGRRLETQNVENFVLSPQRQAL